MPSSVECLQSRQRTIRLFPLAISKRIVMFVYFDWSTIYSVIYSTILEQLLGTLESFVNVAINAVLVSAQERVVDIAPKLLDAVTIEALYLV